MYLEGRLNPGVITDSPVLQCPISKQDLYNSLYPKVLPVTIHLSVLTQDERFEQAQANGNKGGLKNMCEVLDRAEARGEERGISIGEARGELKGAVRAYLDVKVPIEEIAKKLNISVEEVQKIADTL